MEEKNAGVLLMCMLSGLTIGNFLGEIFDSISFLNFLNYGETFGLTSPVEINAGFLILTFKIEFSITLVGIVGLIIGVYACKRI